MKLSTSTNILFERKNCSPIDPLESIALCAKAGFKKLDFCFHDLTTYQSQFLTDSWKEYMHNVRKLSNQLNIEFGQGHAVVYDFCAKDIDHGYHENILKRCIQGASILGIKWLVMHPSTMTETARPFADSKLRNVAFFTKWCKFAKQYNVGLAVENMWDCHVAPLKLYCTTAEELIDLVDSVPGLGICWDVEHGGIQKIDQKKSLQLIGNRLKATHISDYTNSQDIHLLPFLGRIDWNEVMESFSSIDYEGDFSLEIHRYLTTMPLKNTELAIKLSYEIGSTLIEMYEEG